MDPLYKNLKQQVTCSICLDTYTQPKTISCLHTFCCKCLERHARVSQRQGKFRCPECQAEIDLPEGNRFDGLPNSFLHKSLLGVFEGEETCPQHTEERVRYYCSSCEACICPICVAEDHRGHAFDVLENAVQEDKKNIMLTVETIKERANLFRAELRKLEKTSEDVERIIAMAKQEVSDATEHVIRMTRQQEKQLLESLEMTRRRRMERINSAKQELISKVKQMSQAAEFAENLVQRRSAADIIQNKNNLKLEELRGVEVPKHRQATFVKFTAASQDNFKLGSIQVSKKPAIVARSTLEGLKQTFQVNVQANFTLCPRTSGGEMSDYPEDQVEFLVTPTKDVTNVTVDEEYDRNVRLNFTPKVPGAYNIEVKINGDKLPPCPMTVQVKERELVVVGELTLKLLPGDKLRGLFGIAVNTEGQIVVTDNNGHCVYVFDKNGNCLRKIEGKGSNKGLFQHPVGISFLNDNEVLISDFTNCKILQLDIQTGTVVKSFGKIGEEKGELTNPVYVTVDDEERIVVTESSNHRIQVMSKEGRSIFTFGDKGPEKLARPTCCIFHKNMFLVSDTSNHCIKAFDLSGTFLYKFGERGDQHGQFRRPRGLLVDSSNNLLVCDTENKRVQQFSLDGRFTGKCITRLPKPMAITNAPDGRILVTSHDQKKVYILK
ncbi:tripartite motif-containing protein 3-like [Pocillopora verrucosa]|uniref:tripartite motif-containing protein 3-like n=1 Tax=Pocillopora verrucosa TaxID=203993 RepID=UPI0033427A74